MLQTILSSEGIISKIKKNYPDVSPNSLKFKHLAAAFAETLNLNNQAVSELAITLGLKWYPRPQGIPNNWEAKLCKSYFAQKYVNPMDFLEYLIVVPPNFRGNSPYILHRTSTGWADARWFYEVIPQLETLIKDPTIGLPFKVKFNEAVNQVLAKSQSGKVTPGQIQAINLFFEKYVPSLEGICSTCYNVMLPKSGAGERWLKQIDGTSYEIRLSAAKPQGEPGQRAEYVSQTIIDESGDYMYAMWNSANCKVEYTDIMKQGPTHIPWEIYDYNKFNIGIPPCLCKKGI